MSAAAAPASVRGRCHNAGVNGSVLELDLDFDAFSGPFDLLLALVLREELELVEVPIVDVVLAYLAQLEGAEEIDLESLSEFLVLVAALCELKSRLLVDADAEDEEELDAESAAEELALRLAEYQRFKRAAEWLAGQRAAAGLRVFRTGRRPMRRPGRSRHSSRSSPVAWRRRSSTCWSRPSASTRPRSGAAPSRCGRSSSVSACSCADAAGSCSTTRSRASSAARRRPPSWRCSS